MPRYKCKICMMRFDLKSSRDKHLTRAHPAPPRPVCPESMKHVRDLLVEAQIPDWVKEARDPTHKNHKLAQQTETILRDLAGATTDHLLSTLDADEWEVVKKRANRCKS